ncbi:MAG: transcriptional regulator [Herbinix sp.]|jgi:predicted DNA-binding transcriptional regulator YafY|nr:transcriptional regulator [Herbinix sp.]
MKLNRLFEITTILLNKRTVTAAELAKRFEVSTRTIYRDIDVLSASGVPVYATQGTNGGISILEEYTVNRTALSDVEKESILFALQSLQATKYPEIETVIEKLGSIFKNTATNWISIDFSPWGANPNANNKFIDIKNAILQSKVIEIEYINSINDRSKRKIMPLRLIFKSQAWYLWGYCFVKKDYRTFRISRIRQVIITDKTFDRSRIPAIEDKSMETFIEKSRDKAAEDGNHTLHTPNEIAENAVREKREENPRIVTMTHLVLEFTREAVSRLCDDYDDERIIDNGDGTYTLEIDFPEDEWVYGYILSFGPFVKVIEPAHIRDIIKEKCKKLLAYYDN